MIPRGDKRLLGAMLQTLLAYPDHPYGWDSVGYYEYGQKGARDRNFIPVKRRPSFDYHLIAERERAPPKRPRSVPVAQERGTQAR
jgi:hypothetical protein